MCAFFIMVIRDHFGREKDALREAAEKVKVFIN
jgi:hypothetical protein